MTIPHVVASVALALLVGAMPNALRANEAFEFPSTTFSGVGEFMRNDSGTETRISGSIQMPSGSTAPVPAVVIGHSSEGVGRDVRNIAQAMIAAGYATIVYDSFQPRGVHSVRTGNVLLGGLHQVADAFAAIRQLAKDPRIDIQRVAYVGASVGGGAAVVAAAESLRSRFLGPNGPRFSAHVAFYPGLHIAPMGNNLTGAPIMIILGAEDDYQRPERSKAWLKLIRSDSPDARVELVSVSGGLHAFLSDNLSPRRWVGDYRNRSLCPIYLVASQPGPPNYLTVDGRIVTTGQCEPGRGASMGYDYGAARDGMNLALEFLRRTLTTPSR